MPEEAGERHPEDEDTGQAERNRSGDRPLGQHAVSHIRLVLGPPEDDPSNQAVPPALQELPLAVEANTGPGELGQDRGVHGWGFDRQPGEGTRHLGRAQVGVLAEDLPDPRGDAGGQDDLHGRYPRGAWERV
jgi:hypothetical protein